MKRKSKTGQPKKRNWLRNKRKEKTTDSGGKARWLETFARELKPDRNLKNDGDLAEIRVWKQSMIRYTNYI